MSGADGGVELIGWEAWKDIRAGSCCEVLRDVEGSGG